MNTKHLLVLLVVFSLSGCASAPTGPEFSLVATKAHFATLYLYRPYHKVASLVAPQVLIDDRPVVSLSSKGYIAIYVRPGERTIATQGSEMTVPKWNDPIKITFESDKQYFLGLVTTAEEAFTQGITPTGIVYTSPSARNIVHRWILTSESEAQSYGIRALRLIETGARIVE